MTCSPGGQNALLFNWVTDSLYHYEKLHQVSLENKVVVQGMEPLISAGTVTHDSASIGREGGRDSKN